MQKKKSLFRNTFILVSISALAAVNIILSRVLRIDLGFARFTLGSLAPVMAGLWFGPAAGALTGGIADVLGSFLSGYAPNPLITVSSVLWGVLPALMLPLVRGSRMRRMVMLSLLVILTSVVCTLGFTTAGLVMLGYDLMAIFPTRLAQFAAMTPVYCILVNCLYYSPVTAFVREHTRKITQRES